MASLFKSISHLSISLREEFFSWHDIFTFSINIREFISIHHPTQPHTASLAINFHYRSLYWKAKLRFISGDVYFIFPKYLSPQWRVTCIADATIYPRQRFRTHTGRRLLKYKNPCHRCPKMRPHPCLNITSFHFRRICVLGRTNHRLHLFPCTAVSK